MIELDFGPLWNTLKEEYLDIYDRIQSENTRFDENSDLSTTYLGKSDVVYQSWLFLSLCHDVTILCMHYVLMLFMCVHYDEPTA